MAIFKNFKDKFNERFFANDEEYVEDEVNREDYEEEGSQQVFDGGMNPPDYNDYSYSPTSGMNPPEYNFSRKSTFSPPEYDKPFTTEKKGGTIYSMNNIRPATKFKLNSITLYEIYGAKEVALLMMEKDTIIIVNFSALPEKDKMRAMDFLDGAKCVTKAILAKLNENIFVFVPENVELQGDFESQVDLGSFM